MTTETRPCGHGHSGDIEYAWAIDLGLQRTPPNEDALDLCKIALPDGRHALLLTVADGLGGGANGEKASAIAVAEIVACADHLAEDAAVLDWSAARQTLADAFARADQAIRDRASADRERPGATTLVTALIVESTILHLYVGDSRLYLLGAAGVEHRTRDQTLAQVQLEVGNIKSEEEATPRQRNTLFAVVGGDRSSLSIEPTWTPDPPSPLLTLEPDRTLLLCSDGLWGQIGRERLVALAVDLETDLPAICQRLLAEVRNNGAPDNIAMILARRAKPVQGATVTGDM